MKTRYKRWQVILGVIMVFALMGIVGHIDQQSRDAVVERNTFVAQVPR